MMTMNINISTVIRKTVGGLGKILFLGLDSSSKIAK